MQGGGWRNQRPRLTSALLLQTARYYTPTTGGDASTRSHHPTPTTPVHCRPLSNSHQLPGFCCYMPIEMHFRSANHELRRLFFSQTISGTSIPRSRSGQLLFHDKSDHPHPALGLLPSHAYYQSHLSSQRRRQPLDAIRGFWVVEA